MTDKWVCIHGHFYQPPRENPWLEAIEPQPSAHPYRDWNERITAECYRPNAAARVVDGTNHIIEIVDNYQRMSFNVGPTLMSWMEDFAPDVHASLIEADRASARRFGGHGSAMAQVYNHIIMPLAFPRDRTTQVRWGIADFVHRYGRRPEGMWLAECAVDIASLESLAAEGIAFTVLAPYQAKAWRPPLRLHRGARQGRVQARRQLGGHGQVARRPVRRLHGGAPRRRDLADGTPAQSGDRRRLLRLIVWHARPRHSSKNE